MKQLSRQKKPRTVSAGQPQAAFTERFICCQCNAMVPEPQGRPDHVLSRQCEHGHLVTRLRPPWTGFLQGLGWGFLLMMAAAFVAERYHDSAVNVLGAAGALCSAIACQKLLQGLAYHKLAEPSRLLARQKISEAVGAWSAVVLSTLFTFQ